MAEKSSDEIADLTAYSAFARLLATSGQLLGSLLSLSAIAYFMGWIGAKAYFSQFGAAWLVKELTPFEIVSHSLSPLFYLGIGTFIVLNDLDGDWPRPFPWATAVGVMVGIGILPIFFGGFSKEEIIRRLGSHIPFSLGLLGAILVSFVLVHFARRQIRSIPFFAYLLFFLAGWLLPSVTGAIKGRDARIWEKSPLPIVELTSNESDKFRLLSLSDGRYYLVRENKPSTRFPRVIVVGPEQIKGISGAHTPHASRHKGQREGEE